MAFVFDNTVMNVATVLSVLAALIYFYLTKTHDFWERLNVAYIKPRALYGNMKEIIQFKRSQSEVFQEFYNHFKKSGHQCGGIFQLRTPVLMICSAELAKDIMVKNFEHFHDRHIAHDENFDPLSAHLIALEGAKWRFVRTKLTPAFSSSKLKAMFASMREVAEIYLKIIEEAAASGAMMEFQESITRYSMDVIGTVAFGLQFNALNENSKFVEAGKKFFEHSKLERIFQIVRNSSPWLYKLLRLRFCSKETEDFFMGVVRDTMEYRKQNGIQRNDFFDYLMKIKDEAEKMKNSPGEANAIELTHGVITAQAFVFFLAGYETSSSSMSYTIYELARHPEIQDKVFEEVDRTFKKHGDLTYECVQDLTYVEQVVTESMRLHPPVGLLFRKCTKPYQIPGTESVIPKGTQAFLPIYAFHHDPEYFPDPQEFRPDRFSPENKKYLTPYAFMPFGHGPRVCIGERLAMMEMKMTIALIIKNFVVSKCEKTKPFRIDPRTFLLNPLDGIWVRFSKRRDTQSV